MFLIAFALGMIYPAWAQGGAVVPLAETALKPVGNGMVDALGRSVINGVTFPVLETVPMLNNATFPELLMNPPTAIEHVTVTPVVVKTQVALPNAPQFIREVGALPQTRTAIDIKEVVTKSFEFRDDVPGRTTAILRKVHKGLEKLQLSEALEQLESMRKGIEYQRPDHKFAYNNLSLIKKKYPNYWDLMVKYPDAMAQAQTYWEDVAVYRLTMNDIQSVFEDVGNLMKRKSLGQSIDQKEIDSTRKALDLLKKRIPILDETLAWRPWELAQKIQCLQRIEYFFKKFVEGKHPIQLAKPILKPNPAAPSSFYSWYLSTADRVENMPEYLRIAVVHDNKDIYREIKRDAKEAKLKWEIRSFTVKEFAKQEDYFLYDVVIGDFVPPEHEYAIIRDPYSRLLSDLVYTGNGGILILSASQEEPGPDTKDFAQLSVKSGIEGTLQMWKESVAYRRYLHERIANFYLNKWRKK